MKRLLVIGMIAVSAPFAGHADEIVLDLDTGMRIATSSETLAFDGAWVGDSNVQMRIAVNGAEYTNVSGCGSVAWSAKRVGTYNLSLSSYVDDTLCGEPLLATFSVPGSDLVAAEVTFQDESQLYDGTAKCPSVVVKLGEQTLEEGRDYELSYEDNVNPGVGKVVITGIGSYKDEIERTFQIVPAGVCSLDLSTGTRTAKPKEELCFDQSWFDSEGDAHEIRIVANGDTIFTTTDDMGVYAWNPTTPGTYKLQLRHYADGYISGDALEASFVVDNYRVKAPVISPATSTFPNVSQEVTIDCENEDATILYTTDGSDPLESGRVYKHGFTVYKTTTVRAIAVQDGWWDSTEAQSVLTRADALGEAANFLSKTMETGETDAWTVDATMSSDGEGSSLKSATPTYPNVSYLKTSVSGAGTLSFWWRAKCENPEDGEYYDYCAFLVGGNVAARLAGNDTGWVQFVTNITTTGKHVLKWEYRKDDEGDYKPDCAWVDHVQWIPANGTGFTMMTPEQVPYSWITQYGGEPTEDYEKIGNSYSGKTWGGKATKMWEEYVAGTDPTNELSVLTATIEMVDGVPVVKWRPDLNEDGTKELREYHIWGSTNLVNGGDWEWPTNALHRFFKVTVELP